MNSNSGNAFLALLIVLFIVTAFPLPDSRLARGEKAISSVQELIDRLEEEYSSIRDFSATVELRGTDPSLKLAIAAIPGEEPLLRMEYLAPQDMKGQFFVLDEKTLYQYNPAQDMIIKEQLDTEELPVQGVNLTPGYLIDLLRSEDFEVTLEGTPENPYRPSTDAESESSQTDSAEVQDHSESETEQYVVSLKPTVEGYHFRRQLIWLDSDTLLPTLLETFLEEDEELTRVTTSILEMKTNQDLDPEQIKKLPSGARVFER